MESKHASVTKSRRVSQVVQLEIRVVGLLQLVEFFAAPPHLISISAKPQLPTAAKQIKRFFFLLGGRRNPTAIRAESNFWA